jgi:hypothetical protein
MDSSEPHVGHSISQQRFGNSTAHLLGHTLQ